MARRSSRPNAEEIILQAVEGVVARASAGISRAISDILAARIDAELKAHVARAVSKGARNGKPAPKAARPVARVEIEKWVADRRARRVPNFVIEQTGLKTKKAIVAKFGDDAVFEKNKPLPKAK